MSARPGWPWSSPVPGSGEDGALRRARLLVAGPALGRDAGVDAAAVRLAHLAVDEPVRLEPADEPRQRALAEVDALGHLLHAAVVLAVLGEPLEDLELAHPEAVLRLELALQRAGHARVTAQRLRPGVRELGVRRCCHLRPR